MDEQGGGLEQPAPTHNQIASISGADSNRMDTSEAPKPAETGNRFNVLKYNAVAYWSYAIAVDNCAICRNEMLEKCNECQGKPDGGIHDECAVAWGVCNHLFHSHCIARWLKTRSVCPLDNTEWQAKLLDQST
ncbi:putative RING-box protein 1 [Hypsibius exemplaris]|uniref:RING-box protein 1 n=1 Tax=Hypsibius exemplaris TaxID=2072580 RepID=A0A1W0WY93_HYPEX|nr:putative RING-box protein 1 [Hypsibius exemplaris]